MITEPSFLGTYIRDERIIQQRSGPEVADAVGINLSTLYNIERGERRGSFTTLMRIARVLALDIDHVVAYDGMDARILSERRWRTFLKETR